MTILQLIFLYLSNITQIFQEPSNCLKILGARRVTQSKFHTKRPPIFGTSVQNLTAKVAWGLRFVHPESEQVSQFKLCLNNL